MNEMIGTSEYNIEPPAMGAMDRVAFGELMEEPGLASITIELTDESHDRRESVGFVRDPHLMSADQALARVVNLARSALATYPGNALVRVSAQDHDHNTLRVMAFAMQGRGVRGFDVGAGRDAGVSGDPNSINANLVQQNMAMLRMLLASKAHEMEEMRSLRAHVREIDRERGEFIRQREDFLSQRHERDLATKMAEAKLDEWRSTKEKIFTLLGLAYNKVKGHEVVRQMNSPLENMIYDFLRNLDHDKLQRMVDSGALSEQDRFRLANLMEVAVKSVMVTAEQKIEDKQRAQAVQSGVAESDPMFAATVRPAPPNAVAGIIADVIKSLGVDFGKSVS
jgi:hypothetical protein